MDEASPTDWAPDDPRLTLIRLRAELLTQGYDDRAIARAVRGGELVRVRRGAYVSAPAWRGLDDAGRHAVRTRAVLAQARSDLVVSHVSALVLWDGPTWRVGLDGVHGTRRDGRAGRREAGVVQHRGALVEGDVVVRHGLEVTSPTKTALDLTTVLATEAGLVVVNQFLNRGLTDHKRLAARYAAMKHDPSTLGTGVVLGLADAAIESVGESRALFLCWRQGLPRPTAQWEVVDDARGVTWRLDLAWPEHGVWVEFDGMEKYHRLRRPGETIEQAVMREKAREDRIRELTGWRCIRLTWADLATPELTAMRIARALFPAEAAS